jgi:hypothetical protein
MFDEPPAELVEALATSVARVLGDSAFKRAAGKIAAAIDDLPPIESAAEVLSRAACSPVT